MGGAGSVGGRIEVGGLWTTLRTSASSIQKDAATPESPPIVSRPDISAGLLVWRSASHGTPLARGEAMTQVAAVHYCTRSAHGHNELVEAATTPTQITYRTPAGTEVVYLGTRLVRQHRPARAGAHR
jgi:hypothetical protein